MTLDLTEPAFPNNVVAILGDFFSALDDQIVVVFRPLRPSDPNFSVAVYATEWAPSPDSVEFRGINGVVNSTLQRYTLNILALCKHSDAEIGIVQHSVLSEAIRSTLDDDPDLRIALGGLSATVLGSTKRLKKWWALRTGFLSGELQGNQTFLSVTQIIIEVEKA